MDWQSIDFQKIMQFDRGIVAKLQVFLQEKEDRLARRILEMIPASPAPMGFTSSLKKSESAVKLSDAIEEFSKHVRLYDREGVLRLSMHSTEGVTREVNTILWDFTEILEGCSAELFQQVHQISIDNWSHPNFYVVGSIKDLLIHYIDDLIWAIRRLERPLKEYCFKIPGERKKKWWEVLSFRREILDGNLLKNLDKTERYLRSQFTLFSNSFKTYTLFNEKAEESVEQLREFPVFALLDVADQDFYIPIYRSLKLLEINSKNKGALEKDIARSFKNAVTIDHAAKIFKIYFHEIKTVFFRTSIDWKSLDRERENFQVLFARIQERTQELGEEVRSLIQTIGHYRSFVLKHDPDPYVSSRWGFSEWIVGPEPVKVKKLADLIYSANELDELITGFMTSLLEDSLARDEKYYEAHSQIETLLHEIGQPLMSREVMKMRCERLLECLKRCDELGSPHMNTIHYVYEVLSKAMRLDWKYHVLHEIPLFHKIYLLHQELVGHVSDQAHIFRLERFQALVEKIKGWVVKEGADAHVAEIEFDMNDIKTYLQDFFANIQRVAKEKSSDPFVGDALNKFGRQLMEYRYLFGQFFFYLSSKGEEGIPTLRQRFLFIDQYFESIEDLLHSLREC